MQSLDKIRQMVLDKYGSTHPDRFLHTEGVVEMALELSKRYKVDSNKAMIAAYMHDYCKYDSYEEIEPLLTEEEIKECRQYPFLYHAYGSAYMYKKYVGEDPDIFHAIYHHVFGRCNMSMLEAIIMISDYTEKNRKYASCIECRKILLSGKFDEAILYSLEQTIAHVKERQENPHPRQLEVYQQYLERVKK